MIILAETRNETVRNSTTSTSLQLDVLSEDVSYTCLVFTHGQEYSFISKVEVNGNLTYHITTRV